MKKRILFLSLVSLVATLTTATSLAVAFQNRSSFYSAKGTGGTYYHYEAVGATCSTYGIKEYWTNCKDDTTLVEPLGVSIVEKGQPTESEISAIVAKYGAGDERIIAMNDNHDSQTDASCLGRLVCSRCHEIVGSEVPTIDFQTNGIYEMYDWYLSFGAPDKSWVTVPDQSSIQFLTYNPDVLSEIRLPNIYFAGFDLVSIDLSITYQNEKYSFNEDQSDAFTIPSNSYSTKLVFSNISETSMTATLRDSSNVVLLSKTVTDASVLKGDDGFKFFAEGVYTGTGHEVLSNFTFVENHVHNYAADPNCIGKEICSDCLDARAASIVSFDFTQSIYGAYDYWDEHGTDSNWVVPTEAGKIQFVNADSDGSIFNYHLPRIYFANRTNPSKPLRTSTLVQVA